MPKRPFYPALTLVACAVVGVALLDRLIEPFVPEGAPNSLVNEGADFLHQGGRELIKWHKPSEEAFALARKLERPILLVIGAPWSEAGRRFDHENLRTERVQSLLNQNFVCIRVDAEDNPDWAGAYLPLTRALEGHQALPDLQIYILDPLGRLLASLRDGRLSDVPNESDFIDVISRGLTMAEQAQHSLAIGKPSAVVPGGAQSADITALLSGPVAGFPDFAKISKDMAEEDRQIFGHPLVKTRFAEVCQPLWPQAWMFELASGQTDAVAESLRRVLLSPVFDPIDGGFYHGAKNYDRTQTVFDKVATQNAEMALLLARLFVMTGEQAFRVAAERTLDYIFANSSDQGLLYGEGYVVCSRIGDEIPPFSRSARSSFGVSRLDSFYSSKKINDSLALALSLGSNAFPQRSPAYHDLSDLVSPSPELKDVLAALKATTPSQQTSSQVTLHTDGIVVARCVEAARLLGDDKRMGAASLLYEQFGAFRAGPEVLHVPSAPTTDSVWLGDLLAYSDACLQDFFVYGRLPSLAAGFSVLNLAIERYSSGHEGLLLQSRNDTLHRLAPDSSVPGVTDDVTESSTAQAIRLAWSYGFLMRNSPDQAGRSQAERLLRFAKAGVGALSLASVDMGPYAGGYALSSAMVADGRVVFCVGKDPSGDASRLARVSPFRMIAPAVGPVRPDLQNRSPGYYIASGSQVSGPFDFATASRLLGSGLVMSSNGG